MTKINTAFETFEDLEKQDKKAKKAKTVIGRYFDESDNPEYPKIYIIIRKNKNGFRVKCAYIEDTDNYFHKHWGEETTITKEYVKKTIMPKLKHRYTVPKMKLYEAPPK